ncbi:MAG: ATP-binding protein [Acidobacteriota bacterium]|nr:ATP-binding protein [Acidobacteriota bacterium]
MSLRMRLFLIFGGLIAVLMSAQWWMLRAMTRNLETQVDELAFDVGSGVASVFAPGRHLDPSSDHHEQSGRLVTETFVHADAGVSNDDVRVGYYVTTTGEEPKKLKLTRRFEGRLVVKIPSDQENHASGHEEAHAESTDSKPVVIHTRKMHWNSDPDVSTNIVVAGGSGQAEVTEVIEDENHGIVVKEYNQPAGAVWTYSTGPDEKVENLHVALVDQGQNDFIVMNSPSIQKTIPIPKTGLANTLAAMYNKLLVGSAGILLLGLLVVALVSHRFATPLRHLAATAQKVGEGRLGAQVKAPRPNGEVGIAIQEFNRMSVRLQELDAHNQVMRQREYLSELGEIADGLAHTIRNPLNTLGLSVEQLSALAPQDEANRELSQVARQQINRIDQWIRSFMALASQGSAKQEDVQLDALLHDVMLEASGSAGVALDIDLAEDLPGCRGVKPELRAVIQALVINAVEASPSDGKILVRALRDGENAVRIEVEDEGPGLPPEIREKLFTPHLTTKVTGSGMGLFLARRIITSRYGGDLTLTDRQPRGVLAVVTIPLEREPAHA